MNTRESSEWWRVCNNPFVIGLSRLFIVIGAPLLVAFAVWSANTAVSVRDTVLKMEAQLAIQIPDLQRRVADLERYYRRDDRREWP